jgi:hypothetical protein
MAKNFEVKGSPPIYDDTDAKVSKTLSHSNFMAIAIFW